MHAGTACHASRHHHHNHSGVALRLHMLRHPCQHCLSPTTPFIPLLCGVACDQMFLSEFVMCADDFLPHLAELPQSPHLQKQFCDVPEYTCVIWSPKLLLWNLPFSPLLANAFRAKSKAVQYNLKGFGVYNAPFLGYRPTSLSNLWKSDPVCECYWWYQKRRTGSHLSGVVCKKG